MKHLKEHSLFILILLTCFLLRVLPLFSYQFTYDELSGLERTQFDSFNDLMEKGVKIDAHPAFVQLLIFCIAKLFGYKTWLVKLPFLLFGFGAIIYGYALGLRNFSKQVGLLVALFLSYSLVFVYYAPIARMYSSGVFFSVALLYYFFALVFRQDQKLQTYFFFALFALLSALNQHINALFAASIFVSGFFFLPKKHVKAYAIMGLVTVVAYLPHLPISLYQLGVGGIGREQGGWLDKPDPGVLWAFIKLLLGTGRSYLLITVLAAVCLFLNKKFKPDKRQLFLVLLFAVNFLIVFIYSTYRAAIYQHSIMLFSGVAFLVFVCSLMDTTNRSLSALSLILIATVLIYKTYIKKDYLHQSVKTVYEYQFERSTHYKKQLGNANVFPVFFDADNIMKKIYFEKYGNRFDCLVSSDSALSNLKHFSEFVAGLKSNYLVLSSALPSQQAVALQYYPYLLENTQTQAINFKLYSKLPADTIRQVNDDAILAFSDTEHNNGFTYSSALPAKEGLLIDTLTEFPFAAFTDYFAKVKEEGNVVLISARFKACNKAIHQLQACIQVKQPGDNGQSFGYAAKTANEFVMLPDSSLQIYSDYFAGTNHYKTDADAKLTCYLWNLGKEKAILKQFNIKVIDYWHNKWHYWD